MQNEISQLFNGLFTSNLGMADSNSVLALYLAAPGILMFIVVFFGREMFRPRWRGYWDAV